MLEILSYYLTHQMAFIIYAFVSGFLFGFGVCEWLHKRIQEIKNQNAKLDYKIFKCTLPPLHKSQKIVKIGFLAHKPKICLCEFIKKDKCQLAGQKCQAFTHF